MARKQGLRDQLRLIIENNNAGEAFGTYRVEDDGVALIEISDWSGDMRPDEFVYFRDGEVIAKVQDRNGDGRLDWWELRIGKAKFRNAFDNDFDGVVDDEVETIGGERGQKSPKL